MSARYLLLSGRFLWEDESRNE